jgi:Protein of unknown function (DUF3175)
MPARKTARGRVSAKGRRRGRWSAEVTRHSDALDLESRVFTRSPRAIAASLTRSAQRRRAKLERAKDELRALHGRAVLPAARGRTKPATRKRTSRGTTVR